MFKKLPDKAIIDGIRCQDDKVLNYLYDTFYQMVKSHILKNNGSEDDVSDVFQESIIVLYQNVTGNNFTLTTELKGYFFGIARNVWNAQLRHIRRNTELNADLTDEEGDDQEGTLFEKIMARAFARLKPDCQMVLRMYYDGCSYEEITAKMKLKNEEYARRKKYLCKEALVEIIKSDPEFTDIQRFLK